MSCAGKGILTVPVEEWTTLLSDYVPFKSSEGPSFEWMTWLLKFIPEGVQFGPVRFETKKPISFNKDNGMLLTFVFATYLSEIDDVTMNSFLVEEA